MISFPDFFFLAKALRSLVSSRARSGPQDMTVPENDVSQAGLVDAAGTSARAAAVLAQLQSDIAALNAAAAAAASAAAASASARRLRAAAASGAANAASLATAAAAAAATLTRRRLRCAPRCSRAAFTASQVRCPSTITDANLAAQAKSVASVLTGRATQAGAPNTAAEDAMSAIFGQDFVLLPRFIPSDPAGLASAFAQSASLVATDPTAPFRWLTQLTHIRPAISRWDEAVTLAQALAGPGFGAGAAAARPVARNAERRLARPADQSRQSATERPGGARLLHSGRAVPDSVRRIAGRRVAGTDPQHRGNRFGVLSLRRAEGASAANLPACGLPGRPAGSGTPI